MSIQNRSETLDSLTPSRRMRRLTAAFALGLVALASAEAAVAGPFARALPAARAKAQTVASKAAAAPRPNPAAVLQKIEERIDALPRPGKVLGNAKDMVDESIQQTVGQMMDMRGDLERFKGEGCEVHERSDCAVLKRRLKSIYTNLRGIRDIVPGYEFLPDPAANGLDPAGRLIDKIPAAPLFGLDSMFQNLTVLDDLEMISVWIDQVHFYSLIPLEEDVFYRLDPGECTDLEDAILRDNEIFDRMKKVMKVTAKVSGIVADSLPRDITIVVAGGTAIPNPVVPVMVLSEAMATDFLKLLEKEHEVRGETAKKCRTQEFRDGVRQQLNF